MENERHEGQYGLNNGFDQLSPWITQVISSLGIPADHAQSVAHDTDASGGVIEVNKLTMKAGALYEKMRYMIDYREEHTIRRSAIERILKRKILFENRTDVGMSLLHELVSGGYLFNASVGDETASAVQSIVDKFMALRETVSAAFLISMAATEIELQFSPFSLENGIAEAFYNIIHKHIRPAQEIESIDDQNEFDAQIYIACRRSLTKHDNEALIFALWSRYVPEWRQIDVQTVRQNSEKYTAIIERIYFELKDRLGWNIATRLRNHAIYFTLIREIIEKYGVEATQILGDAGKLKEYVTASLDQKYAHEKERAKRNSRRAIIYVFITKIILAFVFELPYDLATLGQPDIFPLTTNVIFHPLLLLVITRSIRPLGEDNTKRVLDGMGSMLYERNIRTIRLRPERGISLLRLFFTIFYAGIFLLCFGLLLALLSALRFNIVSIILFVFFLTFVSYFGLRIRYNAKRWKVETADETTLGLLWSIFTLPIVRTGQWLSSTFSAVNIFVYILDFFIETPFKLILRTSDSFLNFLKEKREELY